MTLVEHTLPEDERQSSQEVKRLPKHDVVHPMSLATEAAVVKIVGQVPEQVPPPLHYREAFPDVLVCAEGERVGEEMRRLIQDYFLRARESLNECVDQNLERVMKGLGIAEEKAPVMRRYMLWKIQDPAYIHAIMHGFGEKGFTYPSTLVTPQEMREMEADRKRWMESSDRRHRL